jgi:hypothetical protein
VRAPAKHGRRPVAPAAGPGCGYPGRRCGAPESWHNPPAGTRRPWGWHDVPCPARAADPALYPACGLIKGHVGDCAYTRRPGRPS